MATKAWKCFYLCLFFFILSAAFLAPPVEAGHVCGQSCSNSPNSCNSPLYCVGVCGSLYHSCSGTTENQTCGAAAQYDTSSCNTYDCAHPGMNRTAAWSGCVAPGNCGDGNQTCNCTADNGCSVSCINPNGSCGGLNPCCIPQAPQVKPIVDTVTQVNDGGGVPIRSVQINWTFNDTGSGCFLAWGRKCPANDSNSFLLKFTTVSGGGTKANETAASGVRTLTTSTAPALIFTEWGTYKVAVCAENGAGVGVQELCSDDFQFSIVPPVCTTNPVATNPSCVKLEPTLAATYGNNANQIQYYISQICDTCNNTDVSSPYAAASGWGTAATYVANPALVTGRFNWTVMSQSTTDPIACTTPNPFPTGRQLNVDKTAPAIPAFVPTPYISPNPSCLNEYYVAYNWTTVADTGCAGLNINPYHIQVASDSASPFTQIFDNSSWMSTTTLRTTYPFTSVGSSKTIYAHVQSRDSLDNQSLYSATYPFTIPTPTKYPDIVIQGTYIEDTGYNTNQCTVGMSIDPTNLDLILNVAGAGTSYSCVTGASNYTCTVRFDNQSTKCVVPDHNVTVSASTYGGYESVEWRTNNQCDEAPLDHITVDASGSLNPTPIVANAYFKYGSQSWFKTAGISLNNRSARVNVIPNNVVAYDTDDDTAKYLITKGGGVVMQGAGAAISVGANATTNGNPVFSANNWYKSGYDASSNFTPTKFADYMRSRKAYKTVATTSAILADGIYYYAGTGTFTLDTSTNFVGKNVVIVADQATIDITANIANLAGGALAVIADHINVSPTVSEVDAILIGNAVNIGPMPPPVNDTTLKIDGNLIQLENAPAFENSRVSLNAQKPSLFVKLNNVTYMKLLEYLSVSVYDWKQVQ